MKWVFFFLKKAGGGAAGGTFLSNTFHRAESDRRNAYRIPTSRVFKSLSFITLSTTVAEVLSVFISLQYYLLTHSKEQSCFKTSLS